MLDSCKKQALGNLQQLDQKMCDRLEWSDIKMVRSILILIDTQGWQKSESESDGDDESLGDIKLAIEYIASVFREPLEAKDVNISAF